MAFLYKHQKTIAITKRNKDSSCSGLVLELFYNNIEKMSRFRTRERDFGTFFPPQKRNKSIRHFNFVGIRLIENCFLVLKKTYISNIIPEQPRTRQEQERTRDSHVLKKAYVLKIIREQDKTAENDSGSHNQHSPTFSKGKRHESYQPGPVRFV